MPLLVAVLVFVVVVTLIAGVSWALEGRRRVRARLDDAERGGWGGDADVLLSGARRGSSPSLLSRATLHARLARLREQAGYESPPTDTIAYMIGCGVLGFVLGWLRTGSMLWGVLAAAALGAVPVVLLMVKRQRRLRRFEEAFPDSLDAMARAIRAGNALTGALQMVATEMPDPIGAEFRRVFDETRLGVDPGEALSHLADRVPTEDVRFFCTAVAIQRGAGGNLAEILDRLSEVIRERFKILSHARVLSAQHRWTAICVGLSPVAFAIIFEIMSPGYFDPLWKSAAAPLLLGSGLLMEIVGFFMIWRIAKIKV